MENQNISLPVAGILKEWIIPFIISAIPFLGIIVPLLWYFPKNVDENKRSRAGLLFMVQLTAITLVATALILIFALSMVHYRR